MVPTQDLINEGLQHRAELVESRIDLSSREISEKALKNSLMPAVDFFAYYGGAGAGGQQNLRSTCGAGGIAGLCSPPGSFPTTSYGSTLNKLVNSAAPDKGAGFTLTIPIRNRQAQALQVRSELEQRQARMRLQQIENQVTIEVRNAQFSVTQNRAAVQAAQAAVALARESLDAEQKKFNLGASTSTL